MSNEVEKSYLESQVVLLMQERAALPARFEQLKAQQEARIEAFLQEAGVLPRVKELRAEIEKLHRSVQSHSDVLGGKIEALQTVLDNFHRLKVPPGTEFDPVSGDPLPPRAAPSPAAPVLPAPKVVEVHDPAASGSEVYADPDEGDESVDTEIYAEALGWDEGFAHEVAGEGFDTEDDTDDDTADEGDDGEDDEDDEVADAIENASDAAAVRALLNRYIRKA